MGRACARALRCSFIALRDPKLRDPLSDVVSVIIALNAGARRLRSLLNYRLCSANNVPLSILLPPSTFILHPPSISIPFLIYLHRPFKLSLFSFVFPIRSPVSPSPPISSLLARGERDWVLSDGPQAELRPALFLSLLSFSSSYPSALSTRLSRLYREIPRLPLSPFCK